MNFNSVQLKDTACKCYKWLKVKASYRSCLVDLTNLLWAFKIFCNEWQISNNKFSWASCKKGLIPFSSASLIFRGFWPKLALSILNFFRKKRSFQWYPDQCDRPNGAWDMYKDAQKSWVKNSEQNFLRLHVATPW